MRKANTRTGPTRASPATLLARRLVTPSLMPIKNTASIAWVTPRLPCPSSRRPTHGTIPATRAAYDSSMKAAREAYLSGTDPTYGAVHFNARGDPGRYNWRPKGMNPPGKPLKTQSALTIILTPKVTHPIRMHAASRKSSERHLYVEIGACQDSWQLPR